MLFKRRYICPFCFRHNDLRKVEFRCSNDPARCTPEPDHNFSSFRGLSSPRMMNRVIKTPAPKGILQRIRSLKARREAVCSNCNEKTSERICPACHSELPYTIGDYKDMIFSVIGAKEAGKSHYISILLNKIRNELGVGFNCHLQPLNDQTIKRYRNDFYNPIFRKGEIIQATRSARADFSVRYPLIYTLSFMGNGLIRKNKIRDVATVVFFDTAGEDLDDEDVMRTENRYIYNSSGIILLLDPLQLSDVRGSLPTGTRVPNENTEATDILERTVNLIRKAEKIDPSKLIRTPIAVAFSKIDAIDSMLDPSSCLKYPGKHADRFDLGDFEDVNGEMESLISAWENGDEMINLLRHNFKTYAFFGLSALGCNPHGTAKLPRKPRPCRVEDPFLWLLWKKRMIKTQKRK